jgi:hypothetical protein
VRIAEQAMLTKVRGPDMVHMSTQIGDHHHARLSSAEFEAASGKLRLKFRHFPYREQGMLGEEEIVGPAHVSSFYGVEILDPISHIVFSLFYR